MPTSSQHGLFYTIGHSTRSIEDFLDLLAHYRIRQLADIRSIPRSKRHPQFNSESIARSLAEVGILYQHCPGLGGLRRPRRDSPNQAWTHPAFRGYADYMQTAAFEQALNDLLAFAWRGRSAANRTVVMCAEVLWWRCHRRLLADALVARGIEVRHVGSLHAAPSHVLPPFARTVDGKVTYVSPAV
jgi:uncharacterized protein (DUF488 family)